MKTNDVVPYLHILRIAWGVLEIGLLSAVNIAYIKVLPPPFMAVGGTGGATGAIAIYTRRGGEASYLPAGRQVFKVRGYTPSATALNMNKLSI